MSYRRGRHAGADRCGNRRKGRAAHSHPVCNTHSLRIDAPRCLRQSHKAHGSRYSGAYQRIRQRYGIRGYGLTQ